MILIDVTSVLYYCLGIMKPVRYKPDELLAKFHFEREGFPLSDFYKKPEFHKLQEEVAEVATPFRSVWLQSGLAIAYVAHKEGALSANEGWLFFPDDPDES